MSCEQTAVALILGCLFVAPVCAQRDVCQQRTSQVPVGTKDGAPAPPLSVANFEGAYRRKPVRITSVVINQEPPRVVLLLDASGSMHDPWSESEWNFPLDLAEDLLSKMPKGSEAGLAFFSEKLEPVARPTSDRKALQDHLEALRSVPSAFTGKTALWAAILDRFKMFDRPHLGDTSYVI